MINEVRQAVSEVTLEIQPRRKWGPFPKNVSLHLPRRETQKENKRSCYADIAATPCLYPARFTCAEVSRSKAPRTVRGGIPQIQFPGFQQLQPALRLVLPQSALLLLDFSKRGKKPKPTTCKVQMLETLITGCLISFLLQPRG